MILVMLTIVMTNYNYNYSHENYSMIMTMVIIIYIEAYVKILSFPCLLLYAKHHCIYIYNIPFFFLNYCKHR